MTTINPNPIETFIHENYADKRGATGFAKDSGVTYQTVHKAILGLHTIIPESMVRTLARESDFTIEYWQEQYRLWVKKELEILCADISTGKLEAEALFVPAYELKNQYANFTEWRESLSYSQIDFCKTFLMHQAVLQKYEAGNMKTLPASLVERLTYVLDKVMDYSDQEIQSYIFALKRLPIALPTKK